MKSLSDERTDHIGQRDHLKTIKALIPYLWPKNATEMRLRVVIALFFLTIAKGITVGVPFIYKTVVDTISVSLETTVIVPVGLFIAYGLARVMAQAFGEFRDAIFAKVAQSAIRKAGLKTFQHLHRLSMRFHLDRQTGGLNRAVERGTKGIDFLLNFEICFMSAMSQNIFVFKITPKCF